MTEPSPAPGEPSLNRDRNRALVTGAIAATLLVLAAVRHAEVSAATESVEATVVGNVESTSRGQTHWCPTLRWSHGGNQRVTTSTSCEKEPYPVDSKLRLLVDPDDPKSYVIDAFAPRYAIQIVLLVVGLFFGLYAVAYARRHLQARRQMALDAVADRPS